MQTLPLPLFWRHLLTVLGGSVAAQALPIAAAPLITRLCSPAELGAFSVWFGLVAIAAVAATLRMENAMVLDQARARQKLCFDVVAWSSTWLALLLTVLLVAARLAGVLPLHWSAVLTLGVAAWLTAGMQTLLAYAASHNAFAPAAKARVVAAGGVAGAQLALLGGLWLLAQAAPATRAALPELGVQALLAGQLLGLAAGLLAARHLLRLQWLPWLPWLPKRGLRTVLPTRAQRRYLHRHRVFWQFSLPSNLLNAAVGQLPLLIIGARHGAVAAGLFALTQRVLAAPISLLASSVLEVFKREAVRQYQDSGNCRPAYLHALRVLLALGVAPALILLCAAPALFALAFGEAWRGAGELAQLLAPLFFLNFVASPLSYVFFVAGRQRIELAWQVALFAVTVGAFTAPLSLRQSVLAYTLGYSLLYLLYLQMSYRYARNNRLARSCHGTA